MAFKVPGQQNPGSMGLMLKIKPMLAKKKTAFSRGTAEGGGVNMIKCDLDLRDAVCLTNLSWQVT